MKKQRGFSLIEALIALVVLSIGLIGVAATQLKALQSATVGYQRSVASVAAVDAQERLWAELATLDANETCESIDTSTVETAWRNHWFQNEDPTPLKGADLNKSTIREIEKNDSSSDGCWVGVNVALSDDDNDYLDYSFLFPKIEN